jgi:hypothetical protein
MIISTVKRHILPLLIIICIVIASAPSEAEPELPENFVYYIFWSGIRAGTATFDFEKEGEDTVITSNATSASLIALFYKVDDLARSILYSNGYPREYTLKIREGRHRRDKATSFGIVSEDGSQRVVYRNILDNEEAGFDLEQPAYDPLSALYEIRKRPLKIGQPEYINIFENKKLWKTEVQVIKKERIRVPAGEFDTIMIKPVLKSEGIFLKKGDIYIWLTDDDRRIPVMIQSKVTIGSFKVKLAQGEY